MDEETERELIESIKKMLNKQFEQSVTKYSYNELKDVRDNLRTHIGFLKDNLMTVNKQAKLVQQQIEKYEDI